MLLRSLGLSADQSKNKIICFFLRLSRPEIGLHENNMRKSERTRQEEEAIIAEYLLGHTTYVTHRPSTSLLRFLVRLLLLSNDNAYEDKIRKATRNVF
jgi:hypothetical protein